MSEVDGRATGDCSIFVKKGIPHEVLELDTELQAVAVKVSLHKTITVCNVYIPPCFNVAQSDIDNLVNQLPAPFLFIGDFNAHSDLWGCSPTNSLDYKVEHLLEFSLQRNCDEQQSAVAICVLHLCKSNTPHSHFLLEGLISFIYMYYRICFLQHKHLSVKNI